MSPIECTEKSPLFSLISRRFGSYEVRRLKLAVVGVEDTADVKQQSTKGQENEKKKDKNDTFAELFSFVICAVSLMSQLLEFGIIKPFVLPNSAGNFGFGTALMPAKFQLK